MLRDLIGHYRDALPRSLSFGPLLLEGLLFWETRLRARGHRETGFRAAWGFRGLGWIQPQTRETYQARHAAGHAKAKAGQGGQGGCWGARVRLSFSGRFCGICVVWYEPLLLNLEAWLEKAGGVSLGKRAAKTNCQGHKRTGQKLRAVASPKPCQVVFLISASLCLGHKPLHTKQECM